uniref:Major facilitator superfamily (MFS) profile domain-containing protein n=2 Tax=Timema TaxID=61471 RepID=A0A7R9EE61_9NEOP|nr:unnamed protein product [Timema cristinae]CAD7432330.1 unnamed protein product [Timema monikensis]
MPGRQHHQNAGGPNLAGSYSESAALVRSTEGMAYTEEGGGSMLNPRSPTAGATVANMHSRHQDDGPNDGGEDELMDYVDSEVSVLAQFHEDAIRQAGFGYFQWVVLLVVGLGLAADTIELFVIAFILPSAEVELCIDTNEKGWLAAITFLGMMTGAVMWGNLSDRMGRRRTLMSALGVNAVFSVIAALMPTFGTFMTARFCSGIGIGGAFPIVLAYFAEFLCKSDRARYLSLLLMFWALGGVFVALVGWAIIPSTGAEVVQESKEHFSAWHQFLLVCSLPSLVAVIGLVFLPESPRYLLEAGREVEAMMVYQFWNSFLQLFIPPNLRVTSVLLVLWFTAAFGYYGLTIWFPDYIKQLKVDQYTENTNVTFNATFVGVSFNTSVENVHWMSSSFIDCRFHHLILSHVTFSNCTLEKVEFSNVKSSRTYFKDSLIQDCRFVDTDLSHHFENCKLDNNTVLSLTAGCALDFDYNIHLDEVFRENLVGQLAILPGAFISAFVIDKMGRVKMIGVAMFLSSVTSLFIWFLDTNSSVIAFEAIFNFVFICAWNTIDIATIESYSTHLRTTGFGFLSASCRLGGLMGVLTFRNLITSSRSIPMLTTAAVLLIGGIISVRLPETRNVLL